MSVDINRSPEQFRSDTARGRVRETGVFVGIVKGNKDPHRMGRLAVYIPELGGSPGDPDTWYTVSYCSPFAGATNIENNQESGEAAKKQDGTQKSYGWWAVPPDVNNEVLCCFINGDTSKGIWFGCLYQQFMNHMVPAIGLNRSTDDAVNEQNLPPVCEYNKRDKDNESTFWDPKRPIFEPLYNGLRDQGLFSDPERGPATTGARRESPSKVFGFITPRGNNIHIDDDEQNEFIRLRTRSGVQILIHETTGYIYMISKKGNSWLEISDEGIDMYSKKTISMRAEEGVNMHGDMHHTTHGGGAVHSRAENHTMASDKSTNHTTEGPHTVTAKQHDQTADKHNRYGSKLTDAKQKKGGGSGNGKKGPGQPTNFNKSVKGVDMDKAASAIKKIESGSYEGNYKALGPISPKNGDRAYGAYQVMGNNVGNWTEKYYGERLTPQQFLNNPAAQDAVFQGEYGNYINRFGSGEAAAQAWLGGPRSVGNTSRTDFTGTSIGKYASQYASNYGNSPYGGGVQSSQPQVRVTLAGRS